MISKFIPKSIKPLLIAAAVSAALSTPFVTVSANPAATPPATAGALNLSELNLSAQAPGGFSELVDTVRPAVVAIEVGNAQTGAGFITDPTGYIVTSADLIANADKISVTLHDGTAYDAELIGRDPQTRLAVLKIAAQSALPYVSFGNSDKTRSGDWAVVVGKPQQRGNAVSKTMLTEQGQAIASRPFGEYLRIAGHIGRANAGSPVFNIQGQVIGVSSILSQSKRHGAVSYAIPAQLAKVAVEQLRDHGNVQWGWLGVKMQTVTAAVAASLGMDQATGALVVDIMDNSPAATAGLVNGDIILRLGGEAVDQARKLTQLVAKTRSDEATELEIWRQGQRHTIMADIGVMPGAQKVVANDVKPQAQPAKAQIGLTLTDITPELRQRFTLPAKARGAVIVDVRKGSPAYTQGLRSGDVISMVGQMAVATSAEVAREVKKSSQAKRPAVLLLVQRGADTRFVTVEFA